MSQTHARKAAAFAADEARVDWHSAAPRDKRDWRAKSLPEWEQMRETVSQMKLVVLAQTAKNLQ